MTRSNVLLISMLMILASGCARNAPKLDLSDNGVKNTLIGQLKENLYKKQWIEYNCADSGYYNSGISNSNAAFDTFNCGKVKKDPYEAIRIRTNVVDSGIGIIDDAYGVYVRDIRKNRSTAEFMADLLEIGASTSIGIIKGRPRVFQIIGVALTGFRGGRKSAQLNFYDEKTTDVLIKRMDASRSQILGEIREKQVMPAGQYSFDAALDDIIRYFDVGTLNRAFTELDKQASIDAEVARLGVLKIQGLNAVSKTTSIAGAKVVIDFTRTLVALERDLQVPAKRDVASAKLKSLYDQIAAKEEFKEILKSLRDIASGKKADDIDRPGRNAKLKSAFDKLDKNQTLTGEDYLTLVDEILSETETTSQSEELRKIMLDTFNSIQ